nr:hypothetical protein [uncultured bacterium]
MFFLRAFPYTAEEVFVCPVKDCVIAVEPVGSGNGKAGFLQSLFHIDKSPRIDFSRSCTAHHCMASAVSVQRDRTGAFQREVTGGLKEHCAFRRQFAHKQAVLGLIWLDLVKKVLLCVHISFLNSELK